MKAPPYNLDAERSVLGAVLLRNEALERVTLQPADFHDLRHATLWTGMLELERAGKPIDPTLLEEQLNGRGGPWLIGAISDCVSAVPTADNVEFYAEIVARLARERGVRVQLGEILASDLEVDQLIERAGRIVERARSVGTGGHAGTLPLLGHAASDFLGDDEDLDDDSEDWVVRGLILRGAPNVIAGPPKSKKTMVALHLAISVAAGMDTWLGRFPIRPGRVLVMAHEDAKRETRRRLWRLARGMGIDPRRLSETLRISDRSQPFHFDNPTEMAGLVSTLEQWRPSVVLMDSLSRVHVGDENAKRDMNVVTDAWLTLAAKYDLAIVTIHHLVKVAEARGLISQLRGSGDIGAALRHAVGVARDGKDADRLRLWSEGNSSYQLEPLDLDIVDGETQDGKPTIELSIAGGGETVTDKIKASILLALAGGPATSRQLRVACKGIEGSRSNTIDDCAKALERAKKIRRLGGGPWQLI